MHKAVEVVSRSVMKMCEGLLLQCENGKVSPNKKRIRGRYRIIHPEHYVRSPTIQRFFSLGFFSSMPPVLLRRIPFESRCESRFESCAAAS